MQRRSGERGEGRAGCIFSLILLVAAVFVAYKMIPIKVAAADLRQTIVDEAKSAGSHRDPVIRRQIMAKAQKLNLPLDDQNLKINRTSSNIHIEASYTVPIEFPGYTYHWKFRHSYENPIF